MGYLWTWTRAYNDVPVLWGELCGKTTGLVAPSFIGLANGSGFPPATGQLKQLFIAKTGYTLAYLSHLIIIKRLLVVFESAEPRRNRVKADDGEWLTQFGRRGLQLKLVAGL